MNPNQTQEDSPDFEVDDPTFRAQAVGRGGLRSVEHHQYHQHQHMQGGSVGHGLISMPDTLSSRYEYGPQVDVTGMGVGGGYSGAGVSRTAPTHKTHTHYTKGIDSIYGGLSGASGNDFAFQQSSGGSNVLVGSIHQASSRSSHPGSGSGYGYGYGSGSGSGSQHQYQQNNHHQHQYQQKHQHQHQQQQLQHQHQHQHHHTLSQPQQQRLVLRVPPVASPEDAALQAAAAGVAPWPTPSVAIANASATADDSSSPLHPWEFDLQGPHVRANTGGRSGTNASGSCISCIEDLAKDVSTASASLDGVTFKVVTWNLLADGLDTQSSFPRVQPFALEFWKYRFPFIVDAINALDPDVICVQELNHPEFLSIQLPGYYMVFVAKLDSPCLPDAPPDGCAIFVRRKRFAVMDVETIYFRQPASSANKSAEQSIASTTPDTTATGTTEPYDGTPLPEDATRPTPSLLSSGTSSSVDSEKVVKCDSTEPMPLANQNAIAVKLRCTWTGKSLLVVTTHLKAKEGNLSIREGQVKQLLQHINRLSMSEGQSERLPVVFCGDFNSDPPERVVLESVYMDPHTQFSSCFNSFTQMQEFGRVVNYHDGQSFKSPPQAIIPLGPMKRQNYDSYSSSEPAYTTWKMRCGTGDKSYTKQHTIDYMFATLGADIPASSPQPRRILKLVNCMPLLGPELTGARGLPSPSFPSDHLFLMAEFMFV